MNKQMTRNLGKIALAACVGLLAAAPALAEEAHGGRSGSTSSYFTAFLMTDYALGTSLIWACFASSVAIISLIIQNLLEARAKVYMPPVLLDSLEQMIADKQYKEAMDLVAEDKSSFGKIMKAGLHEASRGFANMEMAIEEKADEINNKRVRGLVLLEVAGAAGPMVGLFGTVFGMILSFQNMLNQGGQPKAAELAGGIATALVCTFWGLIVGIPGVLAASLFRVKYEGLTAEAIIRAKALIVPFRPGAAKKPGGGAPAAAGPATPKPVPA
jgi:biopolymer transport protein ExbB